MHSVFNSPAWHTEVADLVGADDGQSVAEGLISFICSTVSNNGTSLLAFHKDASPEVLHHSLAPQRVRHYLDRYLAGPYLLDPLYQLALRTEKRFTRAELSRLRLIEPIVRSAMQRVWDSRESVAAGDDNHRDMHQRLTRCFENFGKGELTHRERQITQLLLRGHSSKSTARELGIAPGTVMVHKRNLFAKLGITSQYELFSSFIDALTDS